MDQSFRKSVELQQRDLRVLNQKEDRDLQRKLNMLDKQNRYSRRRSQQRRESLLNEHRRVFMVKACEPKATVHIAMEDIWELKTAQTHFRSVRTSDGIRLDSSRSRYGDEGSKMAEQNRSVSAPTLTVKTAGSVRHRGRVQGSVSLMQMKNIATIDSISEKEVARRRQEAREKLERLKKFQREALHKKVAEFIEKLKDKSSAQILEEPP